MPGVGRFLPLSSEPRTRPIVGFDTEDDGRGHPLQLVFTERGRSMRFTSPRDALGWAATRRLKSKTFLAATQLEYDVINLVKDGGLSHLELGYSSGASKLVWGRVKGTRLAMLDSLNYVPMGVARLGESIGLPKLPFAPTDPEYCIRDATITEQFMVRLQSEINALGGELRYTAGGSALDLWRRKFQPFVIEPTPEETLDWMQRANYGGRVEVFTRARVEGTIRYDDLNSLYPHVLASIPYPNPNTRVDRLPDLADQGILECTVEVPDSDLPTLPYRARLESGPKLIFPVGRFSGIWTTPELRDAVAHGARIVKAIRGVKFLDSGLYFRPYVETLYPLRPRDGGPRDLAIKLLLNALFGKFGQRNLTTEMVPVEKAGITACGRRVFQGYVFQEVKGDYPAHACQVWAAWTLANARLTLLGVLRRVLEQGSTLCYADTDSVIYAGGKALPTGDGLGQLKRVGVFRAGEFLGPKLYALRGGPNGDKLVAKGVPVGEAGSMIDRGLAEWIAPLRLREGGDRANVWTPHRRERLSEYDKRTILPDGRTRPLRVRE